METRKQTDPGRVLFVAGRRSVEDNALRPSRLFFMSKDIQKAALRVKEFFKEMEPQATARLKRSTEDDFAGRSTFQPAMLPDLPEPIQSFSVTDLGRYVRCPYRFYLEKLRRFNKIDDDAIELDNKDFGNVIHKILQSRSKPFATLPKTLQSGADECLAEKLSSNHGSLGSEPVRFQRIRPYRLYLYHVNEVLNGSVMQRPLIFARNPDRPTLLRTEGSLSAQCILQRPGKA